jgi:hypothetical protein
MQRVVQESVDKRGPGRCLDGGYLARKRENRPIQAEHSKGIVQGVLGCRHGRCRRLPAGRHKQQAGAERTEDQRPAAYGYGWPPVHSGNRYSAAISA